jgi:hypothetical protein
VNGKYSTARVMWTIWCLAWAAVWVVLAAAEWPRQACTMLSTDASQPCLQYGTSGSTSDVLIFAVLAILSVVAILVPVGLER